MFAAKERELVVALPVLCLAACLPSGDIASYSDGLRGNTAPGLGGIAAEPSAAEPGTGGEGSPAGIGLVQTPLEDGGVGSETLTDAAAVADAGSISPCGVERSLGPSGNCYLVETTPLAWQAARDRCRSRGDGWDLASLRTAGDSAFAGGLLSIEAWIGASDIVREGSWTWINNGDAFWAGNGAGNAVNGAYTNWNSNEPNGGETSDCARALPRTAMFPGRDAPWADVECSELKGALCEGPL